MSDLYYLKWKNRQFGPFTQDDIAAKMRQGAVTAHHLVSVDKVSWKSMRETFPDLFPKAHIEPVSAGPAAASGMYADQAAESSPRLQVRREEPASYAPPEESIAFDQERSAVRHDALPGARREFVSPAGAHSASETVKILWVAMTMLGLSAFLFCIAWLAADFDAIVRGNLASMAAESRIQAILFGGCSLGLYVVTCLVLASLYGDGWSANIPLRIVATLCTLFGVLLVAGILAEAGNPSYWYVVLFLGIITIYLAAVTAFYAPKLRAAHEWMRTTVVIINAVVVLLSIALANSIPGPGLIKFIGLLNALLLPSILAVFILARINAVTSAPVSSTLVLGRVSPLVYKDGEGRGYTVKCIDQ